MSKSKPQTPLGQLLEKPAYDNNDGNANNKKDASKENVDPSQNDDTLKEQLPLNSSDQESCSVLFNCGSLGFTGGYGDSIGKSNVESNNKCLDLATNYSTCADHLQGTKLVRSNDRGIEGTKMSSEVALKHVDDLSNDFANTFMLDEELEFEHKTIKKDDPAVRRYCELLSLLMCFTLCSVKLCLLEDIENGRDG